MSAHDAGCAASEQKRSCHPSRYDPCLPSPCWPMRCVPGAGTDETDIARAQGRPVAFPLDRWGNSLTVWAALMIWERTGGSGGRGRISSDHSWVQSCQCRPLRINWFRTQFPKHLRFPEPLKVDPDALDLGQVDLDKQSPTTITAASGSAAMRSTLRPDDVANGFPALGCKS